MKKDKLQTIVNSLRDVPIDNVTNRMVAFSGSENGKLECPWLKWALENCDDNQDIGSTGILIMQDWGVKTADDESVDDAVATIKQCIKDKNCDRTIGNLLSSPAWEKEITNKNILVTNAVWGLRPQKTDGSTSKMCGYLGDRIHKRAFLRWGSLVKQISSISNDEFRIFVAGEWARFDDKPNNSGEEILNYLKKWRGWASKYKHEVFTDTPELFKDDGISGCKGKVIYLSHPCTWNLEIERDPRAKLPSR